MLQKLNEKIQGIFAWVIITLVVVTFAMFGVEYYIQSRHEGAVTAKVNGEEITQQDFELNYRRNQRNEMPATSMAAETQQKKSFLETMILKNLVLRSAKSSGFDVSTQQANFAIQSIPQFQENGRFSNTRFQQVIRNAYYSPSEFQKEVISDLLLNQQRFAFSETEFALSHEVAQFVQLSLQSRTYQYLVISYQTFMNNVVIGDQQIESYYKSHLKDFKRPEKISVDYVRLSMADIKAHTQVTDQMIQTYYAENKTSTDPDILTPERKEKIKQQLLLDLAQTEYSKALDQLSELAYQTPDSLQPLAETLHLNILHSPLFSLAGGDTALTQNKGILKASFSPDVLKHGNNSEPIQLDHESVVILRVGRHEPESEIPLEEVKSKIKTILAQKEASQEAKKLGQHLLSLQSNPLEFNHEVAKAQLNWIDVQNVQRNAQSVPEYINQLAFNLGHPGDVDGKILADGNFGLVRLNHINEGHVSELNPSQIEEIHQRLQVRYGAMDYDLYVKALLKKADIIRY